MKKDSYYQKLEESGHYDSIDKRSKDYREYKEWKKSFEEKTSIGLGDAVEAVTKATGIKKAVEVVTDAFLDDLEGVEIDGFDGYFVTKSGDIYSTRSRWGKVSPKKCKIRFQNGYPSTSAYPTNDGKRSKTIYVHRELGKAFLPKPKGYDYDELTINHKDGNRANNSLDNLEWVTLQENIRHQFTEINKKRILTEDLLYIYKLFFVESKTVQQISKEVGFSKNEVESIIYRGTNIYHDNFESIVGFFEENQVEPNNKIKKRIASCGCDERKEKFNKVRFWRKAKINCISEEDYKWYVDNDIRTKKKWSAEERNKLVSVYNSIFNTNVKATNCSSCVRSYQENLNKYVDIYNS